MAGEASITPYGQQPYIHWGAVMAGTATAAALAFVLHAFGGAIGLAVSSTAPTWRDASFALWLLSGIYLILVALASYGLGGYVAGRLRPRIEINVEDEVEFRDGVHGLLVWAIATLLTGLLIGLAALGVQRLAAPSAGPAGPATSVGGENILAYEIDRLFRAETPIEAAEVEYNRAEAGRILLTAGGHDGVRAEDRAHLIRLVSARAGLAEADATTRVDAEIAAARQNLRRARRATVLLAFMTGAAALLGSVAAWFAAGAGGRHRDETVPVLWWPASTRPLTRARAHITRV
jgi:hypothetical protein